MRLLQTVLLSLIMHLLVTIAIQKWAPPYRPLPETSTIEVDLRTSPDEKKKSQNEKTQIVRQNLVPDQLKAPISDDPLAYLSEQTQRVKEQMKALQSGLTKNRSATEQKKSSSQTNKTNNKNLFKLAQESDPRKPGGTTPVVTNPIQDALRERFIPKSSTGSQSFSDEQGISTVAEELSKDLPVGNVTVLNTDQFTFYSFYNRVNELTYPRWTERLEPVVLRGDQRQFSQSNGRPWVTDVDIWLKPSGEVHSAHVMKESGIKALDRAAIQAFLEAKFFPNPPLEKVEDDGFIHLRYRFHVYYNPKVVTR